MSTVEERLRRLIDAFTRLSAQLERVMAERDAARVEVLKLERMREEDSRDAMVDQVDARRYRCLRQLARNWPINSTDMVELHIVGRGPTLDDAIDALTASREQQTTEDDGK